MKKLTIFIGLAFLLVLCATPVYANGIPALPHAFYGSVTINGVPASVGTRVEARGEGVWTGIEDNPTITSTTGIYGTSNPFEHKLVVQGDIAEGETLTFYVNGVSTKQTAPWHSEGITPLNLTVTIAAPPPAAGGGGLPALPPGTTSLVGLIDYRGVFTQTVTAMSFDDLCRLIINKDTIGLTKDGKPLSEISMTEMEAPPPSPEASHVIGLFYDFQPSGATFEPAITLTFSYDPADIPEGIAEEDLVIAYYDQAAGEWVNLEVTVDTETNTITALISHFTAFTIFGYEVVPEPAAFTPGSLVISPSEVDIGQTVNVSILVSNTGGMAGDYVVMLKINDVAEAIKKVTVAAGASREVTFTTAKDVAGSYSVDVNGLSGSFTVKEEVAPPAPPPPPPPPPEVKPFNWPLVGGIIGGVIIVGLLIFFLVVRRRAY